jgi:hypothetical protein
VGGVSRVPTALGASSEEREVGRVELEVIVVAQLRCDIVEDVVGEIDHFPAGVAEGVVLRLASDLVDEPAFPGMHVADDADAFEHLEGAVDGAEMGLWLGDLDDGGDLTGGEVTVAAEEHLDDGTAGARDPAALRSESLERVGKFVAACRNLGHGSQTIGAE